MSDEGHIERSVVYYGTHLDCQAVKLSLAGFRGTTGWPDRMFLAPLHLVRRPLFIEFKDETMLSEVQREKIKWLRDNGYPVHICRGIEHGKMMIRLWLKDPKWR